MSARVYTSIYIRWKFAGANSNQFNSFKRERKYTQARIIDVCSGGRLTRALAIAHTRSHTDTHRHKPPCIITVRNLRECARTRNTHTKCIKSVRHARARPPMTNSTTTTMQTTRTRSPADDADDAGRTHQPAVMPVSMWCGVRAFRTCELQMQ